MQTTVDRRAHRAISRFVRRDFGAFGGNTEAIERNRVRYPRRSDARKEAGNVATETVADNTRRLAGRIMIEQRLEIGEIIDEPVAIGTPFAAAESAPVGCNDEPIAHQCVDQKLKRCADIHPAMQHE